VGDIVLDTDFVAGNRELTDAWTECDRRWRDDLHIANGIIAINVRQFVDSFGNPINTLGATDYPVTCNAVLRGAFCLDPSMFNSFRPARVALVDNAFLPGGDPDDSALPHELRHALALGHGDGLDNDCTVKFDLCCD